MIQRIFNKARKYSREKIYSGYFRLRERRFCLGVYFWEYLKVALIVKNRECDGWTPSTLLHNEGKSGMSDYTVKSSFLKSTNSFLYEQGLQQFINELIH